MIGFTTGGRLTTSRQYCFSGHGSQTGIAAAFHVESSAPACHIPDMPRRIFLTWSQPLLPAVVEHLCAEWKDGALDLSHLVAVVPTAEAGRRVKEALALRAAARGTAVLSPHIITPEVITAWALAEMPAVATPAETLLVWMQVLTDVPLEDYAALFPVPPVSRDATWARSTAGEMIRLRHRLEEGGRTLADATRRLGAAHPETERWNDLARLEKRVLAAFKKAGLTDSVTARLAAAASPVLPPGVTHIVVMAVPDPVHLVVTALENAERQGAAINVLIHGNATDGDLWDEWGRPLHDIWGGRVIEIPEPEARIRLVARPEDEAAALVEAMQQDAALAIGSADPEIAAPLEECAARGGVAVFDPGGLPLTTHGVSWMLTCLTNLLRTDSALEAARMLRLPDLLTASGAGVSAEFLLRDWDEFQQAHLPRTLRDAVALAANWTPRRKDRVENAAGVLTPVLHWLNSQCGNLRRARTTDALYQFMDALFTGKTFTTEGDHAIFQDALEQWQETLDALGQAAERTGYVMDTVALLETAQHLLRDVRLYPDNIENAPALSGWLELPWLEAPHLAVAGLNEGMAPDSITGDPWLPDSVRGLLNLKTNAIRLARDSYLLTSLIECRRSVGSVQLLAARESAGGDPLKPSRLLLRCPEEELAARALRLFPAEEMEDARPSPPSWHRAWRLRPPTPDLEAAVFTKMSVTQFSDYLSCPFRFYLKHILRMEPFDATRDEMDARDFGSLIHDSLQALHMDATLRDSDDEAAIGAYLDEKIQTLTTRRYGVEPTLPIVIQLESARNRLRALAGVQAAARADGWRVEHVEVSFPELPDNKEPVKLDDVLISGRIDLIERHKDTGQRRVIDYKTGAKGTEPDKAHLKALRGAAGSDVPLWQLCDSGGKMQRWTNLQLPVYAWVVSRMEGGSGEVQAGYINLPPATSETAVNMWEGLDDEMIVSAISCARGVIRSIRQGIFWPPARSPEYDDFKGLWFQDVAESFDPGLLEQFRELRK